MSLHPQPPFQIPPDTVRVAVAAFPKGNIYIRMRDELGTIYTDEAFAPLFPLRGKPALAPARLALITIMQFIEGLKDLISINNQLFTSDLRKLIVTVAHFVPIAPERKAESEP